MAFIHSGINEKTIWLVLCVQKSTQETRQNVILLYVDSLSIGKILNKVEIFIFLLFIDLLI